MNKIAKIFDLLLIISTLLFSCKLFAEISDNCSVSCQNKEIVGVSANAELLFSIPKDWKIAKAPKVTVIESENITNCLFGKRLKKVSPTKYILPFHMKGEKNAKSSLKLSIEIPLCSNICTIISQDLTINLDFSAPSSIEHRHITFIMLLALLGGLILNIMPCVLPIILMKLRLFAVSTSNKKAAICGTIVGNYTSFFVFATFLILIRAAGEHIGWGMHFQNLNFLKIVAIILFVLSLYSLEVISFPISFQIIESKKRKVFFENLISSIVASIIAIPCTAPFLGTAAAFAIQGTIMEMSLIFFSIATGFSLPYILALIMPVTTPQRLGKYGNFVKIAANCGVVLTFTWILYLIAGYVGAKGILIYLSLFALSALFFIKKFNILAVICLILNLFTFSVNKIDSLGLSEKNKENKNIERIIKQAVAENRIIIFNISADWCLTCKYNKINVLNNKEISILRKEKNILYIECDMTKKNDFLMKIITDHGRIGIPFTIVFGPKAKNGILLSELLTVSELKDAVSRAE